MKHKEILPIKVLRKFDAICLRNKYLHQNKELQQQILDCITDILTEAREDWAELHATTIASVVQEDRKIQAQKRGQARDKRYAPFREYFKQVQKERFKEYQEAGQKLTANNFVEWFFKNLPQNINIPYRESNIKNKLLRLAQENNKKFKALE